MSQIYNLEPPTCGKVVLQTSHGPLEINLWSQEAPTTTKNFLQHCMNGYYDNLPFHRIIPNVLAQTGDPTKSGNGGVAAIGDPTGYPRELHGRLKFRRRGLVAMVCDGGVARSQFFITLSSTDWLNGEHSIFGEVGGDTIYNLLNLAEKDVDGFDVEGAPRVLSTRILENPFPELVPRKVERSVVGKVEQVSAKRAVRKRQLLSFAGSDSEDEDVATVKRGRSRFAGGVEAGKGDVEAGKEEVPEPAKAVAEEEDEVIRRANEEFARLKAQLDDEPDDEPERPVEPKAKERTMDNGKRKRRRDESSTLNRLKAFENRVKKSRKEARRDERGRIEGAWFERGLRLATSVMQEEEYEVHFSKPGRRR